MRRYLDEEKMVGRREKVVGDRCHLAAECHAGQLCVPLVVSLRSESEMRALEGTCLRSELGFEVFEGDFLICHRGHWL